MRSFLISSAIVAIVAGLIGWSLRGMADDGFRAESSDRVQSPLSDRVKSPTAMPTRVWHSQIRKEGEALSLSLQDWPAHIEPRAYAVRLMSLQRANEILGSFDGYHSPDNPVWLVAILAVDGLPMREIRDPYGLNAPYPGHSGGAGDERAPGIYWMWNANTGDLMQKGNLSEEDEDQHRPQFSDIEAERSQALAITTPSPMPTGGPAPNHTPQY